MPLTLSCLPTLYTIAADANASTATDWLPGALLAAGMVVVCGALLLRWHRLRHREHEAPRDRIDRISTSRERDSLESLMVEVQELTRTCAAQIENRALELEALLNAADRRIAKLQTFDKTEPSGTPPMPEPPRVSTPRLAVEVNAPPKPQTEQPDPVLRRVVALAEEGQSPTAIARETGIALGKVELMLRLHRRVSA